MTTRLSKKQAAFLAAKGIETGLDIMCRRWFRKGDIEFREVRWGEDVYTSEQSQEKVSAKEAIVAILRSFDLITD